MVPILGEDYLVYAEAKGLKGWRILTRYALRNCYLPQVTAFGISLGFIFNGNVLVEQLFNYPGLGTRWSPRSSSRLQHDPRCDRHRDLLGADRRPSPYLLAAFDPRVTLEMMTLRMLTAVLRTIRNSRRLATGLVILGMLILIALFSPLIMKAIGGGRTRSSWRRTTSGWCPGRNICSAPTSSAGTCSRWW